MLFNVTICQIGDIYGVPKLKERAKEKFEDIISTCRRIYDFPATTTEVYSTTPAKDRGLRDPKTSLDNCCIYKNNTTTSKIHTACILHTLEIHVYDLARVDSGSNRISQFSGPAVFHNRD